MIRATISKSWPLNMANEFIAEDSTLSIDTTYEGLYAPTPGRDAQTDFQVHFWLSEGVFGSLSGLGVAASSGEMSNELAEDEELLST